MAAGGGGDGMAAVGGIDTGGPLMAGPAGRVEGVEAPD